MTTRDPRHNETEPRVYSRREIIQRIATTSVAAAGVTGLAGWLVHRQPEGAPDLLRIRDHRVPPAAGAPTMAIVRGPNPVSNVRKAVQALGGMEHFVRRGETVLVKPNCGWNRLPEQAANSHPDVVAEIVRLALQAGAGAVWVTDVTINNAERCFERSGIGAAARAAGAKVLLPDPSRFRLVAVHGRMLSEVEVYEPFIEADRVINVPTVKQHGLTGASLSMKNWYGVLGGHRVRLHQRIDDAIVDLAKLMMPTLTILDGTRALVANGPSGGSTDDVKVCNTIAAGVDEVALDAFGATLLGLLPSDLSFLRAAQASGLGSIDYRSLKLVEETG